jgi:hypothetical protein
MAKKFLVWIAASLALLAVACDGGGLMVNLNSGGGGGAGGNSGGAGGFAFSLPDGGLSALFGDGGLLSGGLAGQIVCGPEAKLGAKCSGGAPGCVLPSLGGVCVCLSGNYLCPANPAVGPTLCPAGATTGKSCVSPLSTCLGGGGAGCICGVGTYVCL